VVGGRSVLRSGAKAVPGLFARQGDYGGVNFQISDQATAPSMRKTIAGGHGMM
jgi:hypothetical protein